MLGFVLTFALLWMAWAVSPLSAPLIVAGSNPLPDMLAVLKYAAVVRALALRLDGLAVLTNWSTRVGALLAMAAFALVTHPPFYFAFISFLSEPRAASGLGRLLPKTGGHLIDWYSLHGLILLIACALWIGLLGLRAIRT